jgi:hypothetical protein
MTCSVAPVDLVALETARFTTIAPAPLPTRVGDLSVPGATGSGVDVLLSGDLALFLPLATLTLTVDGMVRDKRVGLAPATSLSFDASPGGCTDAAGQLHGGTGVSVIKLSAHVAGASSDPVPATTTVNVDCDTVMARLAARPLGSQTGGGCSTAARGAGSFAGTLGLLGGALVLHRRRRSTRR